MPTVLAAETSDYVDNNTSDVDSHANHGTESSFASEQSAPDSVYDTLTEEATSSPSTVTAFSDGFEAANFALWDQNGATTWTADGGICNGATNLEGWASSSHSGTYYAGTGATGDGELETDNIDLSGITSFNVTFWFAFDDTESGELVLNFWDGAAYDLINNTMVNTATEDTWYRFSQVFTDSQYFDATFRMQFVAACGNGEAVYVDDVLITKTSGAYNYELNVERQWTAADYAEDNEELCIYMGSDSAAEDLMVDVWGGSSWTTIIASLAANSWNNVSVSAYLTSATFTIRFMCGTETGDDVQDSWEVDSVLIHTWSVESFNYVVEFSQGVSASLNLYPSAAFKITNSAGVTYAGSVYPLWSANTALTQGATASFNLAPTWNTNASLSQGITSSFTLAPQTNFTVATSLSTTFSFLIDTFHQIFIGNNYVADLSLAVSTAFDALLKWDALAGLTQGVSVSVEVLVGSTFHVVQSLGASFSFIVDIIQSSYIPVAYVVDLTLGLTSDFAVNLLSGLQYTVDLSLSVTVESVVDLLSGVAEALSEDSLVLGAVLAVCIIGPIAVATVWFFGKRGDDE